MARRAPLPLFIALLATIAGQPLGAQDARAVAARRIDRGAVLAPEDITGGAAAIEGWIARRVIQPGEALEAPAVAPPPAVRSRQPVTVLVTRGSINLSLAGSALADASLGDTIMVRLDARRRLRAVVSGPGRVTALTLPSR